MIRRPIALLLLLAGCSGGASDDDDAGPHPAPVALVSVAPVGAGALTARVTVYGTSEAGAAGTAVLSAPTAARVVRIAAPVGTRVAAGQTVAELALAPDARLDLAKAQSDARAADAALARALRLRRDGLVSDAEVETARAAATAADLTRASLASRAGGLTLRAPQAGVVESVASNPGDLVQPGAAVATVARLSDVRAHFGVDPATARVLHPGMPIEITAADRPALAAQISSVSPLVDPQTRMAAVFAPLPAGSGIGPGEPLSGTAATPGSGGKGAALTVPYAALLDDGGQPYVYVVAGGVAHRRDVVPGASGGARVAITRGLQPGDRVVVAGGTALEDGMKVRTR